VLDKSGFKNNIDWGLILLVGVLLSLAGLIPILKVDRWLIESMSPVLTVFSFHPLPFLMVIALAVYTISFFLRRTPTVILLMLSLTSWAQDMGIHPGVLLLSILMTIDSWFLPYQSDSYQITYYSTGEKAFSHAQARKLMIQ
jgi:di/tricarboxylate transporter